MRPFLSLIFEFFTSKYLKILGIVSAAWHSGLGVHHLHSLDKNVQQGSNGSKQFQFFIQMGLLNIFFMFFELLGPVIAFGKGSLTLSILKSISLIGLPFIIPLSLGFLKTLKRDETSFGIKYLEEEIGFYNKYLMTPIRWISSLWPMRQLHHLLTTERFQTIIKWTDNHLASMTKFGILLLLYPVVIVYGNILYASVFLGCLAINYMISEKYIGLWLGRKIETYTAPLSLYLGLILSNSILLKFIAGMNIFSQFTKEYLSFKIEMKIDENPDQNLDTLIKDAFENSDNKVVSFSDLFDSKNHFDLKDNLKILYEYCHANTHRIQFNFESLSKSTTDQAISDPVLLAKCENIKFEDILDFYDEVGSFTDPTLSKLLTAGQLAPNTKGVITNSRFNMAVNEYDAWKSTCILSNMPKTLDPNCRLTQALLMYTDKVWTSSPGDQIEFARFSLLSMLFKLKTMSFSGMSLKSTETAQQLVKACFLTWQEYHAVTGELDAEKKLEAIDRLSRSMKEFALSGEFCAQGNYEQIDQLCTEWLMTSRYTNKGNDIASTLPGIMKSNLKTIVWSKFQTAFSTSTAVNKLIDVNDQHIANTILGQMQMMGLDSFSANNDKGVDRSHTGIEGRRIYLGALFDNLLFSYLDISRDEWLDFMMQLSSITLTKSHHPQLAVCNHNLVEHWYLEQLGYLDKNSPMHPKNLTEAEQEATPSFWQKPFEQLSDLSPEKADKLMSFITYLQEHTRANGDIADTFFDRKDRLSKLIDSSKNNDTPKFIMDPEFNALILPIILKNNIFTKVGPKHDPYLKWETRSLLGKTWVYTKQLVKFCTWQTYVLSYFSLYMAFKCLKATPSFLWNALLTLPSAIKGTIEGLLEFVGAVGHVLFDCIWGVLAMPHRVYAWMFKEENLTTLELSPTNNGVTLENAVSVETINTSAQMFSPYRASNDQKVNLASPALPSDERLRVRL